MTITGLTTAFTQRLTSHQVVVKACYPGDVNSQLSSDLGFGGQTSPDDGARTPVRLASQTDTAALTGQYCADEQVVPDPFTQDKTAGAALYQLCLRYSG
jgi:hypothetical protein